MLKSVSYLKQNLVFDEALNFHFDEALNFHFDEARSFANLLIFSMEHI